MQNKILLIITTVPNKLLAEKISKLLIKKRLAACVSINEIESIYKWQGNIEQNKEFELTIKTLPEKLYELTEFVKDEISYEIPELIYKKFDSEINYYKWVKETLD
tara:strand:- start:356 stop:670 length:315 start_codon:yes stop_codon:yes gene_type:complete